MTILVEQNEGAACLKAADCESGDPVDLWYVCGLDDPSEEVWEIPPGGVWQRHEDQPGEGHGKSYGVSLYAGQMYRAGIYSAKRGPTSARPDPLATAWAMAVCNHKPTPLIKDSGVRFGGTFAHPYVQTTEPTTAMTAVSVHRIDEPHDDGQSPKLLPQVFNPADGKDGSEVDATSHLMLVEGLHPGERYYYLVVVVTPDGRWDYRIGEFTTKRRKITVTVDQLDVLNDGDVGSVGEARFWFEVGCWEQSFDGKSKAFNEFEVFTLPRSDVDDGQKIKLGFAHIGDPTDVTSDASVVRVRCWGDELDDFGKDRAQGETLRPIPRGANETVRNEEFFVPCLSWDGDPLIFKVHCRWSVDYV